MLNKSRALCFGVIILALFVISSCATAPDGYLNKGDYLYVDGYKDDAAIVFTAKLFNKLYPLPLQNTCHLDLKITQLNYEYSGWNGVELLEIRPGYHVIYVGIVGRGIPHMDLSVEANKVYILNCEAYKVWTDEIIDAQYIPQRKVFIYEGIEYEVP